MYIKLINHDVVNTKIGIGQSPSPKRGGAQTEECGVTVSPSRQTEMRKMLSKKQRRLLGSSPIITVTPTKAKTCSKFVGKTL